jgi:hypothetical protein
LQYNYHIRDIKQRILFAKPRLPLLLSVRKLRDMRTEALFPLPEQEEAQGLEHALPMASLV